MIKRKRHNTIFKPLAELCYNKAIRKEIEERVESRYLKRINHLIGANNQLMKELEQWERVGKRLEKATDNTLSTEEAQIVHMPWLKEHIIDE